MKDYAMMNYIIATICIVVGTIVLFVISRFKKPSQKEFGEREKEPEWETGKEKGKYRAWVWTAEKGIHTAMIEKPIGNIWNTEPSLKRSGPAYFVSENVPVDPRSKPIIEGQTANDCYEALRWDDTVGAVYTSIYGWWDKVKTLVPYLIVGGMLLVIIIVIDKVFG